MKKAPIIFCHYGNSKYLPYVFECVAISNPDKEIILLGDDSNRAVATKYGINHIQFRDYDYGDDIELFDKIYQLITTGDFDSYKHGEDWNKFVFRKWFTLYNFLAKNSIESFWHLDSDVMILSSLSELEENYKDLDCTEHERDACMKGFFANIEVVNRYNKKINEVFQRLDFLEGVKKEMVKLQSNSSFNEMSVYAIFRKEESIKTRPITDIINDSFLDNLICRSAGMKMEKLPLGEDVKVVHFNPDGRFFCIEESSGKPIQAHSLNLSWVPIYVFKAILKHYKKNHLKPRVAFDPKSKTLSQVPVPLKQKFKKFRKDVKRFLKGR
jgi:hypothetical protein